MHDSSPPATGRSAHAAHAARDHAGAAAQALLVAVLALPWLWGWAPGPSAQAVPLLAGWVCLLAAAGLWLAWPAVRVRAGVALAQAWLVAALVSSVIGLAQWFGWADALGGAVAAQPGLAFGNLRQRNLFASLCCIGLLALLCLHALEPARTRLARAGWALAALLLALGCAASLSRTGALQWLLICGGAAVWHPRSRPLALVALLALLAGSSGLPVALEWLRGADASSLAERLAADLGCSSRTVLWSNVLHLIAQRPWTGWGAGELDWAHYATLYPGERFCDILDNAHNLPLHVAVEFGVPAAAALCAGLAWLLWRARPWRARAPLAVLGWGVLGVLALHSQVEYPLWYAPFQIALLAALLLVWRGAAGSAVAAPAAPWRAAGGAAVGAVAAGLAGVAWALWCYAAVSQAYLPAAARWPALQGEPPVGVRAGPFGGHAGFARLSLMPLTRANAAEVHALAAGLLHFSPEPRVIQAAIDSALQLGRDDIALWHLARFRAAFPAEHAAWLRERTGRLPGPPPPRADGGRLSIARVNSIGQLN